MTIGHEKLDVYRLLINYVAWVYEKANKSIGPLGISGYVQVNPCRLNIAEGNGKATQADRRRYFEIARGWSARLYKMFW